MQIPPQILTDVAAYFYLLKLRNQERAPVNANHVPAGNGTKSFSLLDAWKACRLWPFQCPSLWRADLSQISSATNTKRCQPTTCWRAPPCAPTAHSRNASLGLMRSVSRAQTVYVCVMLSHRGSAQCCVSGVPHTLPHQNTPTISW